MVVEVKSFTAPMKPARSSSDSARSWTTNTGSFGTTTTCTLSSPSSVSRRQNTGNVFARHMALRWSGRRSSRPSSKPALRVTMQLAGAVLQGRTRLDAAGVTQLKAPVMKEYEHIIDVAARKRTAAFAEYLDFAAALEEIPARLIFSWTYPESPSQARAA